jgi:carbon monoxide dehydrogenase subunit G
MIRVEQKLVLAAPPEAVWPILTDPAQVAACLPGAEVGTPQPDGSYPGAVSLKVGPITVTYRGVIRFERLDPASFEADLIGQGQDIKGKGGAEMRMRSQLRRLEGGGTAAFVTCDVGVRGLLAQMGRGMIESVAARVFDEFAAALNQRLAAGQGPASAPEAAKPMSAASLASSAVAGIFRRRQGGPTNG